MRRISIGRPPQQRDRDMTRDWIIQALFEIERASIDDDTAKIADAFTITNHTPTYTLDVATATATDVANVFATLIDAMRNRGTKKGL